MLEGLGEGKWSPLILTVQWLLSLEIPETWDWQINLWKKNVSRSQGCRCLVLGTLSSPSQLQPVQWSTEWSTRFISVIYTLGLAAQTLYGSLLEFEFNKRMYEKKQNMITIFEKHLQIKKWLNLCLYHVFCCLGSH